MAGKLETEKTPATITIIYRPNREIPAHNGNRLFDLTERIEGKLHYEFFPIKKGRNLVPWEKWRRISETEIGKQYLRLGVLQPIEKLERPVGEKPENLSILPVDNAVAWIESEVSLHILRSWSAEDFRPEIQDSIKLRLEEIRENRG